MNTFLSLLAVASLVPQIVAYTKEALADQVTNLPGAEKLNLKYNQFSGYISIPGNTGNSKQLHYWCVLVVYISLFFISVRYGYG
jgi:hypothetical protein